MTLNHHLSEYKLLLKIIKIVLLKRRKRKCFISVQPRTNEKIVVKEINSINVLD